MEEAKDETKYAKSLVPYIIVIPVNGSNMLLYLFNIVYILFIVNNHDISEWQYNYLTIWAKAVSTNAFLSSNEFQRAIGLNFLPIIQSFFAIYGIFTFTFTYD